MGADRIQQQMTNRCAQLTSVHALTDTRIRYKECRALIHAGYEVLLIGPGENDAESDGVHIRVVPKVKNRFRRMTQTVWRVYRKAMQSDADIFHFHDPEMMTAGLLLKLRGKRVIYDVHEDLPRQILNKHWLPKWSRRLLAWLVDCLEAWAAGNLDGIVAATPTIVHRFPANKAIVIYNYPRIEEFRTNDGLSYLERPAAVSYVGGISINRGIKEMMQAMSLLPTEAGIRLKVAGWFDDSLELEFELPTMAGFDRTDFLGCLSRECITDLLAKVRVGLVVIHPTENFVDSLPVKLFEYMAAGLPVVASDFPIWREIVEATNCGFLVDPLDSQAIVTAIQWLFDHPDDAAEMGRRGKEAVLTRFNWKSEEQKLLALYHKLLHDDETPSAIRRS